MAEVTAVFGLLSLPDGLSLLSLPDELLLGCLGHLSQEER